MKTENYKKTIGTLKEVIAKKSSEIQYLKKHRKKDNYVDGATNYNIFRKSKELRDIHIFYSLLKGRKYSEIEVKVRDDKKISQLHILSSEYFDMLQIPRIIDIQKLECYFQDAKTQYLADRKAEQAAKLTAV